MRRAAASALLLLLLATSACITPRPARAELDANARKETAALLPRVRPYDDPALAEFLGTLAGRPDVPVRIVRDPTLALFATPDGEIVIHTGLLAVADTDGMLAAVLGHEIQHIARGEAFAAGPPAALGQRLRAPTTSRTAVAIFGLDLPLTARAALTGYGASRERAADAAALEAMAAAGRDPNDAVAMYDALMRQAAVAGEREVFYFGNREHLAERRASVRELIAALPERPRLPSRVEFERRLRPVHLENAYEEIRQGRFDLARDQLERVAAAAPDEPRLHLYYGELHRLEAQRAGSAAARDVALVQARSAYERALVLDPALAEAHRQLGLLYYAMRDLERARGELERYLVLAPSAPDRTRIGDYVMELAR
ncbi:MAG TPA: tetratricopeptide repeat protein [Methylomirabilota bacterium]|nr:tetratricopeptide repeat protein [Methylomirabilota bacterium]